MINLTDTKIALGTAQFTPGGYGVCGESASVRLAHMLHYAEAMGIGVVDTAPAYGVYIGGFGKLKFVQKTPFTGQSWALLQHDPDGSLEGMLRARRLGSAEKVGISVYTPAQMERALQYPIDIIQFPLNLADGRFLPYLPELRKRGIISMARSVFLQGALLMKDPPVPVPQFSVGKCLGYVLAQDVDYAVVGVNSYSELLDALNVKPQPKLKGLGIMDEEIIDPRRWITTRALGEVTKEKREG